VDKKQWPFDDAIVYLTHVILLFTVLGIVLRRMGKWVRDWFDASVRASFKRQWRQRELDLLKQQHREAQQHAAHADKPSEPIECGYFDRNLIENILEEEKLDDDQTGTS